MMTVRTFLPSFNKGRRLLFQCAVSAAVLVTAGVSPLAQAAPGGVANLAMVAEPQTLDPMASTTDLVATIMQHVYEPLYTFDAKWVIQPMLAESLPKVSADGKTVTIELRKGVKFHNG
jgi:peptide/nickel transport system substrate-binding protein